MSDTPTPETDAAWHSFTGNTEFAHNVKNLSRKLERERDEAREALMKIEDLFIDGTDTYADREMMGQIARDALEGAK